MADLVVPRTGPERPWASSGPGPGAPSGGVQTDTVIAVEAEVAAAVAHEWPDPVVAQVDQVEYPTRMARRRALQAAQITNQWRPDPTITSPVLGRVQDELSQLLDRRFEPSTLRPFELATAPEADPRGGEGAAGDLLPATARRARFGRRWIAVLAVLAVVLAGVAGLWATTRAAGAPAATAVPKPASQQVVALALSSGGQVTGVSLLASGAAGAQQVLVPSRLLLDVPGAGRIPVAQSLGPGPSAPGAAIADALEIRVLGTWALDSAALATLVDGVGGVVVDVDADVRAGQGAGGAIVVPAGTGQRLSGAQAAAYAQWLVDGEPEAARLARQERVVTAVLAALPTDAAQRRARLVGLPGAPVGAFLDSVVSVTGSLAAPAAAGSLASTVLPVRDIDAGGAQTSYGLDTAAVAAMVKSRLPGAAIAETAGGRLRVLVQNGVGTPGLGDEARSRLVAAGLKYVGGGNVEGFGVRQTLVMIPDGSSRSRARGHEVAVSLGVTDAAMRITDSAPTIADVVVVLGSDFRAS